MKGGEDLGYKVKRGSAGSENVIGGMLVGFLKRLVGTLIILMIIGAVGYFLFQFAYNQYPPFAEAVNDVIGWLKSFYSKNGIWATLGLIIFLCIAVWAFGEEMQRKERRKQAMKEMMK